MNKALSMLAVLAVSAFTFSANADVKKPTLVCNFTEPFIQIVVLAKTQTIGTVGDHVALRSPGEDTVMGAIESTSVKGGVNTWKLSGEGLDQYVLDIVFGKKGNDGMSDKEYEFEGILRTPDDQFVLYGGCDLVK
ncbi:hypothetical protein [Bdellovibrio sp. HCB288]|uniref:hypothetical protein n=1 Tax=Bdellovibrio sp. HCB288 TaxID=3394355 RepID=UPI0039B6E878